MHIVHPEQPLLSLCHRHKKGCRRRRKKKKSKWETEGKRKKKKEKREREEKNSPPPNWLGGILLWAAALAR